MNRNEKYFSPLKFLLIIFFIIFASGFSETEIVKFADPNLEQAVRDALKISVGEPITKEKIKELKDLFVLRRDIKNLMGLEYAVNLQELYLSSNEMSDVSPLANLANLQELTLSDNKISDLSPLANLTNLRYLSIWGNKISDISPLANLTNLERLDIDLNEIADISSLVNNPGLDSGDVVYLKNNSLDLTPGSDDMQNIQILKDRGVNVEY